MTAGDLVQLRTPTEILATLDATASLEGQPFMPEMLGYFGRVFRVTARADRVCDTVTLTGATRRLKETVLLDDLRCAGTAHGGCQAQCRLYWKEAWLRPAETGGYPSIDSDGLADLEQLVLRNTAGPVSNSEEPTFRCQATELPRAGEAVGWWNARSLAAEAVNGNVGLVRYVRVVTRLVLEEIARRLGHESRYAFKFADLGSRRPNPNGSHPTVAELSPGDLVRVRSKDEILRTLDAKGKNRGLWFDREMLPFCGRTARVKTKVERFVDEPTGRLVELKSDCYILEGFVCSSELSVGRWFCCRAIYPWWRACWLEKISDDPALDPSSESLGNGVDSVGPTAGPRPPGS